jgi:CHAT domain-containing protein/Tfp pilus assembly protein PilF
MTLLRLLALLPILLGLARRVGAEQTPACSVVVSPSLRRGIVVEWITPKSEAERAGIRSGDVLLNWTREDARGEIETPFDFAFLRFEQASRGRVTLEGLRNDQKRTWQLGSDVWGIAGRPALEQGLLSDYCEGEKLVSSGKALEAIERWQTIVDKPSLAPWILSRAGQVLFQAALWDKSDSMYREALERAADDRPTVRAELLRQWASSFSYRDDLGNAEKCFEQEAREWRRGGGQNMAVATTLLDIGAVSLRRGDFTKAESSFQAALELARPLAPESIQTVLSFANLGVVAQERGDLGEAEQFYREALWREAKYFPPSPHLAQTLANTATLRMRRGDLNQAEVDYRKALAIAEKIDPNSSNAADILDSLGECVLDRGNAAKGEEYLKRALAVRQKLVPRSLQVAVTLGRLGKLERVRGNLAKAEEYYRNALAIGGRLNPEPPEDRRFFIGLGDVALARDDLVSAEANYRRALAIIEATAPKSLNHAETLGDLAGVLRRKKGDSAALELYRAALDELEAKTAHLGGIEKNEAQYRASHDRYYREYIDLLVRQHQPELAFETLESLHARTLFELLSRSRIDIRQGVDPALLGREKDLHQSLNAKSQYRIRLVEDRHTDERVTDLDREIAALRNDYLEIESQIQASSPGYAALTQPQRLSAKEIQQFIGADTLLLEYSLGEERSYVWVVGKESLRAFELPSRAAIDTAARRVYRLLTARNHATTEVNESQRAKRWAKADAVYSDAARDLSRKILSPVASLLGSKRLLIVSDGALQYIPFSALPVPEGGGKTLISEHQIVNLPSASVIIELSRFAGVPTKEQKQEKIVAVLADPVFDSRDERIIAGGLVSKPVRIDASGVSLGSKQPQVSDSLTRSAADIGLDRSGRFYLNRLLYTRREADSILALIPKGKGLEILDFKANRDAALNSRLAGYRIVHFATHGLLNNEHPELSGLVLSLVDENGKPQDGFLQLEDIYNLKLPVDLVVLSGCETGLGEDVSGEGLIGLTRGFMYAGASRIVASLWSVNDVATAEFMTLFYKAMLRDKLQPAAALRRAQIEMRQQRRWNSPYYWAAFEIQGEWK